MFFCPSLFRTSGRGDVCVLMQKTVVPFHTFQKGNAKSHVKFLHVTMRGLETPTGSPFFDDHSFDTC